MIYLHENGITVVANDEAKRGKVYELNGEKYYVARSVSDIKNIIDSSQEGLVVRGENGPIFKIKELII